MRILLVNSHGDDVTAGGAEAAVARLASELPERNFEVALLRAFPGPGDVPEQTVLHRTDWREDELRRVRNHLGDVVSRPTQSLSTAIERHRPDVVHTHNLPGIGTGIWEACRRAGVPVVHTLWDYYLLCPRVTLMRADGRQCRPSPLLCGLRHRRLARWSDAVGQVIGCSQYVLDEHEGIFRVARSHVIRNPMPPAAGTAKELPHTPPQTIGYIGALDRTKGVHELLEAAGPLTALGYRIRLAGSGRLEQDVVAASRTNDGIQYDGVVTGSAKAAFFESCDIGVVPSVWAEPGGPTYTMVEWLRAGRPVLVSRRGGLGEVVDSYPGAIPIEPTAVAIVAEAERLADHDQWSGALRQLEAVPPEWTVERWLDAHEHVYRSAKGGHVG